MLSITFPQPQFDIKSAEGKEWIKDVVRKKWVRLTPEEWVRQNWIQYLLQVKNYPSSLLAIEKEIQVGELRKRCDIVVYKQSQPWMMIECKEAGVSLTETTLMQVIRYNIASCFSYLVISNGNESKSWKLEKGNAIEIQELPQWDE